MSSHDYPTRTVLGRDLDTTMVLVGESGGLSAIYEVSSSAPPGVIPVTTEHGTLYLDPDEYYEAYDAALNGR